MRAKNKIEKNQLRAYDYESRASNDNFEKKEKEKKKLHWLSLSQLNTK